MVGGAGFELATPASRRQCSPPELRANTRRINYLRNVNCCLRCSLSRNSYTRCDTSVTRLYAFMSRGFGGEIGVIQNP